ncbi:MAG TPA: peptide chain release factor N(5)-glutamine methyltransferase [Terriglobales bacterium]
MNIRSALAEAAQQLCDTCNPRLDAETLLMHVLQRERSYLYAHPEFELACGELTRFYEAISQRAQGVPLQYITGHQEFWGIDFRVNPAVLIPRPETEHSVEAVLEIAKQVEAPRIVDVGTGSGCIAIALASELPKAEIHAVDISADALAVAKENAERLGFSNRINFAQGDLLSQYIDQEQQFDVVVSNPPYVGSNEPDKVQREVREHEPRVAVFGGPTGLELYTRLIPESHRVLRNGGWLVMEIGFSTEAQIRAMLNGWRDVHTACDLQGIPRVVVARK